jgi:hypothetical protein
VHIYKIIALCIVVALVSIALLLYAQPQNTQTDVKEKKAQAIPNSLQSPDTTILFSPTRLTLPSSGSAEVRVTIATGLNKISSSQLEIRYDPSKITITDVRAGTFFPSPTPLLNTHDRARGRIDFVLSTDERSPVVSGEGNLAIVTMMRNPNATTSATTQIDLLPKTSVRSREQTSLLKSTGSTTIKLEAISPTIPAI